MWLNAPNIICKHGFSTRHGGISPAPFQSLNLGGSQDDPANVEANRALALANLQLDPKQLCILKQVHGTMVCQAMPGIQEGDALVTSQRGLVLAVSMADCYPILLHDAANGVIAAVHAGWRGTVGKIAANIVQAMLKLGAQLPNIQVAIGQGIAQPHFEVGPEVIEQFEQAGFPNGCWHNRHIDLIACNTWVLQQQGIGPKNIWAMQRDTFEDDFFSYRRDNGLTGRMWGLISML